MLYSRSLLAIYFIYTTVYTAGDAGHVGSIPGSGRFLEKEMVIHFNSLVWKISWTEEPGGLQSMGFQRVGHDSATKQQLCISRHIS